MNDVERLRLRHPEWAPWLTVVAHVLDAARDPAWNARVPALPAGRPPQAPLLSHAQLQLDAERLIGYVDLLMHEAATSGAPDFASLRCAGDDATTVFLAAINGDDDGLARAAAKTGADRDSFRAVAGLLPVPLLHACRRRWEAAVPQQWASGYCPVCGDWPAFAEVRGIERSRYLRCGGCGSAWVSSCLCCPYCGMKDHGQLGTLVVEDGAARTTLDVCHACNGYVKVSTTLRGSAPEQVMLEDLATVELDLAALPRGYRRPPGRGHALRVTLAGMEQAGAWRGSASGR